MISRVKNQACAVTARATQILLSVGLASAVAHAAAAQTLDIPRLTAPPVLEQFTDMSPPPTVRDSMAVVTGFTQRVPGNGAAASQRTDVYVGYDERNLYAVFVAWDSDPANIRANLAPRENVDNDDRVGILIDTFNDQRTGYGFRSTPLGVQWDGRWTEVSGGAQYDSSYEAVWDSEATLTDEGYVVLMAIPFRTLRFSETGPQRWRVQFERLIPRASEESYWPAYSQTIDGRLNQAATLEGVSDVSPGRNIQVIPFGFVRSYDVLDPALAGGPGFRDDTEDDIGVDAKLVLRDSLVLDLTYNPDFSQVESDQPQVTVNQRFEVNFPERRPFFIENGDYFATETPLVFTRRIVDPQAGLRFTGRQGPWGIGTMLMDDEAAGSNLPVTDPLHGQSADISILRLYRDISAQSRVGVLYTNREFGDGYNEVTAADTRIRLSNLWTTEMLFVNTDTRDQAGALTTGRQTNIRFDRASRHAQVHAHMTRQSDGFDTHLGILGRNFQPDLKGMHSRVQYRLWPEGSPINSWGPIVFVSSYDDYSDTRVYSEISPAMELNWSGDSRASIGVNRVRERLRPKDFAALTENRDFQRNTWTATLETDSLSRFGFSVRYTAGTDINLVPPDGIAPSLADTAQTEFDLLWRPMNRLRVDTTFLSVELEDRFGAGRIFENRILRTRWNYQFTREWSLRFIAQQEQTDPNAMLTRLTQRKTRNYDILLRRVINPWSALYVGYNTNSSNFQLVDTEQGTTLLRSDDLNRDGEQLFVKFSYLLQP